jgi:ribonuclease P protein component
MLSKKQKFTAQEFADKQTFKNSKKVFLEYGFFLVLEKGKGVGTGKFGIVMSKKNFKTAVLRNKYKRLFYNTLLEIKREDKSVENISLIFYPKKVFTKENLIKDFKNISLLL